METWNSLCEKTIQKGKGEVAEKYGIRFGQTDIYCIWCNKPASFFHICSGMNPERKREIETIRAELDKPISILGPDGWRRELGIELGMSKKEALGKFREWQGTKKTCSRCQEDEYKYKQYCTICLICEEAQNELSNDKPTNFREKLGRSHRDLKIDSLRASPKRLSVDKSRR